MKILLWIGNEPNQIALANKIHNVFPLSGIVTETKSHKPKITLKTILEKIFEKCFLPAIGKSWWKMKTHFNKIYPTLPNVDLLNVNNINSNDAYEFTKSLDPDIVLVSGTRLVKEKMLSIKPKIGILNLHTGLSPYIKGGPNCTNWCIATKQFHLIGNTVMWIDSGIDTGNLLTTEFTPLTGNENLYELHIKVMEHAHNLYLNALIFLSTGKRQSIPQSDIADGKTYYTKQGTLKSKIDLLKNYSQLKTHFKNEIVKTKRRNIKTIKLNNPY